MLSSTSTLGFGCLQTVSLQPKTAPLNMDLSLLLPLLAALQMVPVPVSPAGAPLAPSLSLHPQKQEYFPGDTVGLTCSAPPSEDGVVGFHYFSDVGKAISVLASSERSYTYNMSITGRADRGLYECSYWTRQRLPGNQSNKSNAVLIKVAGAPEAPSLSLHPQKQKYLPGDTVWLTCSAPPSEDRVKEFQYYRDVEKVISVLASSGNSHTYNINITGPADGGSYECGYWIDQDDSWKQSNRSNIVLIKVTGHKQFWIHQLAVGIAFFTINGLIFLISHLCMKREGSPEELRRGSDSIHTNIYSVPFQSITNQSSHSVKLKAKQVSSCTPRSHGRNEYMTGM